MMITTGPMMVAEEDAAWCSADAHQVFTCCRPLIGLINTPPPPFHRYDDSLCYNYFIIIIMVSCMGSYIFEK